MKVTDVIRSGHHKRYTVIKEIATKNRPNAHVYLCEDENGQKFVAKYFYNQPPMPYVAYAKYNHYGRRRDGSRLVFEEIRKASKSYGFIIDHVERIKFNGKWVIILQYIEGVTLTDFIKNNTADKAVLSAAVAALARTLSEWHSNGFAHGDPHLDNSIIDISDVQDFKVYLIDYCQIHHKNFHYCKHFNCFTPNPEKRLNEDLINPSKRFGKGFKFEISEFSKNLGYADDLTVIFEENYSRQLI